MSIYRHKSGVRFTEILNQFVNDEPNKNISNSMDSATLSWQILPSDRTRSNTGREIVNKTYLTDGFHSSLTGTFCIFQILHEC